MTKFKALEKQRQVHFKQTAPYFSDPARQPGAYNKIAYDFCLPPDCASENLAPSIRQAALDHFRAHAIQWHRGGTVPNNHLLSSQVCCVNFLFPFADQPEALAALLKPLFSTLKAMLPVEGEKYVSFEWIGAENYLREKVRGQRVRGANCTSADGIVLFEHQNGEKQIVLIEWKYTESYASRPLAVAASGTSRVEIYRHLFEHAGFPLDKSKLPSFESLFYEPFYQLMRQQCLAQEMERANELGAKHVRVLHIAPEANTDFQAVTSPALKPLGNAVKDVWTQLVREPDRFASVTTEKLFGKFPFADHGLADSGAYLKARYAWLTSSQQA